jgi:transposase-like protein
MSRTLHDYDALELEYIQSDISIRELARKHDIRSYTSVAVQARKRHWEEKRQSFKAKAEEATITTLVMARQKNVAEIHGELLIAVRHAVRRFIKDLAADKDSGQTVTPRDLMGLIDKFLLLTGQPTSRSENKNLDLHAATDLDGLLRGAPEHVLRELAELARENGAGSQPVGRGPLIVLEGAGPA